MSLPLENVRVLDFGQYVAGPAAAALLADQGAEVIRIDPPGGPKWKSPAMQMLNRRKKSIILDLKTEQDLSIAKKLIASADVLIENFRPGVMSKLGIGGEESHRINSRLIYLSLPGFSAEDTERSHIQAWEGVIAAASGQFTDMGLNRILMGINTSFSPLTLASGYAATLGATAASLALYARESCGHGDIIEVPIAAALMEGLVYNSMFIEDCPPRYLSLREHEIDRRKKAGEPFDMEYGELQEFMDPFYRSYFCKDERPVYVVATCHTDHCHKTLKAMDLYEEVRNLGLKDLEDWYLPTSKWPEGMDSALGLYPLSKPWADKVSQLMTDRFLEKSSAEWMQIFSEKKVPVAAHQYSKEWLNSEHALKSGLVHEFNDSECGMRRQAGPVSWLKSGAEFAAKGSPAPELNEHRDEIIAELESNIEHSTFASSYIREHNWLKGKKILDLTNVIAGPTVGNTLGRFGAEVIKIYPIKPTFDPWNTVLIGLQVHRGKRSILVDIKTEKGRETFSRLVKWADVLTFNGPERQLIPLGLDHDSLKDINPKIILFQLDSWGGPKEGPRSNDVGYDDLVQAATGIMSRFGGSINTPEEHAHLGTIDVLTGFAGAFAVSTAIFKQKITGESDVARTSLAACGQLLQAPFMYDYEGREPFDEPSGREVKGEGPLYRCYQAKDGWFFLGLVDQDATVLEKIDDLAGVASARSQDLEGFLTEKFQHQLKAYWVKKLQKIDVGAIELSSLSELREKYLSKNETNSHGSGSTFQFTRYDDHPSGHRIDIFAPCSIRPRYAALTVPAPAEKYGKETVEILKECGFSSEEIEIMKEEGVVSESWSEQYLPD